MPELTSGARILRRLRWDMELTVRQVARETGYSGSYVSQVERGESPPSYRYVETFADAFDLPRAWLLVRVGHLPTEVAEARPGPGAVERAMDELAGEPAQGAGA